MDFWPCALSPVPAIILATEDDLMLATCTTQQMHNQHTTYQLLKEHLFVHKTVANVGISLHSACSDHTLDTIFANSAQRCGTFLNLLKFLCPVEMMLLLLLASVAPSSSCPVLTCTLTSGTHSTTIGADSITGISGGKYGKPSCAYIRKGLG